MLHGGIKQFERNCKLNDFRSGKIKIMIATDVVARGLDIGSIQLVIQQNMPRNVERYIHRSGRTGRAGKSGKCITLINPYWKSDR